MHSTHFSAEITNRVKKPFFCHLINHFKYLDYKFCWRRILRLTEKSQNLPNKVLCTFITEERLLLLNEKQKKKSIFLGFLSPR